MAPARVSNTVRFGAFAKPQTPPPALFELTLSACPGVLSAGAAAFCRDRIRCRHCDREAL